MMWYFLKDPPPRDFLPLQILSWDALAADEAYNAPKASHLLQNNEKKR